MIWAGVMALILKSEEKVVWFFLANSSLSAVTFTAGIGLGAFSNVLTNSRALFLKACDGDGDGDGDGFR